MKKHILQINYYYTYLFGAAAVIDESRDQLKQYLTTNYNNIRRAAALKASFPFAYNFVLPINCCPYAYLVLSPDDNMQHVREESCDPLSDIRASPGSSSFHVARVAFKSCVSRKLRLSNNKLVAVSRVSGSHIIILVFIIKFIMHRGMCRS